MIMDMALQFMALSVALPYADILNIQIPGIENGIEEETPLPIIVLLSG